VFSDLRLLNRQSRAVKLNSDSLGAAKKLYNLVPDARNHFQIAKMKVYKTYEGHITQFCCFEAQKAS
jgi:hypothetical protein